MKKSFSVVLLNGKKNKNRSRASTTTEKTQKYKKKLYLRLKYFNKNILLAKRKFMEMINYIMVEHKICC